MIRVGEGLTVFQDENNPFWNCSVYTEENEHHGKWVVFQQSFPHMLLGNATEKVTIREEDLDKVIEFLQFIKTG